MNHELAPHDIAEMEEKICSNLKSFIHFKKHVLFFPESDFPDSIEILQAEKSIIIPLCWRRNNLGVLILHDIKISEAKKIIPYFQDIISMCLENIYLLKSLKYESDTGLANEETLYKHMANEIEAVHNFFEKPDSYGNSTPFHKICLGMLVVRINIEKTDNKTSHDAISNAFHKFVKLILQDLPENYVCARLGRFEGIYEIGILFPAAGRNACQNLAKKIIFQLEKIDFENNLISPAAFSIGHALYPQDMRGFELAYPVEEQTRLLKEKARQAARIAFNISGGKQTGSLSFAGIIREGGMILEKMNHGLLKINLGKNNNATEGMRFQIFSPEHFFPQGIARGEVVLLRIAEDHAIGEMLYQPDPLISPQPGDRLLLLENSNTFNTRKNIVQLNNEQPDDPAPDYGNDQIKDHVPFCGHAEFLQRFEALAQARQGYILGITRITSDNGSHGEPAHGEPESFNEKNELHTEKIKTLLNASYNLLPVLAGSYGSNGFILYFENTDEKDCLSFYSQLHEKAQSENMALISGLFKFPYLGYSRTESEECALKALEYAMLLKERPQIGFFGSLAINISADRIFSRGDIFAAIEEYKLALLADSKNAMARNSLGVCMASISRNEKARHLFEKALKYAQENELKAKISYNLGTLSQTEENWKNAFINYRRCVNLDPGHGFAWIRLGQLCEQRGRRTDARQYYEKAIDLEQDRTVANTARKHLARLSLTQKKAVQSKELLHEVLLDNPNDPEAMRLLAQSYLEIGDDPEMAEMLIRKSLSLQNKTASWKILAEALEAQAKFKEAQLVKLTTQKSTSDFGG